MKQVADDFDPRYDTPAYRSTELRAPRRLYLLPEELHDPSGPVFGESEVCPQDSDLTRQHEGEPLGERIIVSGRVRDSGGGPVANTLVEVWEGTAAGPSDPHVARPPPPPPPEISPAGRCPAPPDSDDLCITA